MMNSWMWQNMNSFPGQWGWGFLFPLAIWSVFWTGLAMWNAARRSEKWWFIIFLLVHTAGILEILYLFFVVRILNKKSSRRK